MRSDMKAGLSKSRRTIIVLELNQAFLVKCALPATDGTNWKGLSDEQSSPNSHDEPGDYTRGMP
jgi:hypothetical protein